MFDNHVGIDIGNGFIKLAFQGKKFEIEIPESSIENDVILSVAKLGEAIKGLVLKHKLQNKNTVIVYNGPSVFTKAVKIPLMNQKELKKYLALEAENIVPFAIREGVYDHIVLNTEKGSMEILVIAIKNDLIAPLIEAVKFGGLQPAAIDIPGLVLSRELFKEIYDSKANDKIEGKSKDKDKLNDIVKKEQSLQLVLDIGKSTTDIHIYQDKIFRFSRTINIGGDDFDNILASSTNSFDSTVFRGIFSDLQREITRSINYFRNRFGNQDCKFDKVFLVGGCGNLDGVKNILHEVTELKPTTVEEPRFTLVRGLARWKQNTSINLLPLEHRAQPKVNIKKIVGGIVLGAVAIYIITSFVFIRLEIMETNKMIALTKTNNTSLENTLEANKENIEQLERVRDIVQSIEGIQSSSISFGDVLEDLLKYTPGSIQLNSLAITNDQLTFQAHTPDLATLALYLDSLNSWKEYEDFFVSQTSVSEGRYVFSIQGHRKRGEQ